MIDDGGAYMYIYTAQGKSPTPRGLGPLGIARMSGSISQPYKGGVRDWTRKKTRTGPIPPAVSAPAIADVETGMELGEGR